MVHLLGMAGVVVILSTGLNASSAIVMTGVDPKTLPIETELAKRLQAHVEFLASPALKGRKPGTPGNRTAAGYIIDKFQEMGLVPLPSLRGFGQPVSRDLGDNVIGMRVAGSPFTSQPQRWILIGAHYDHLGESFGKAYLGADDNASAIAILIELARALPGPMNHPMLFMAFNTEEPPYIQTPLMGSQVFVNHLPPEVGIPSNIHAVVIMDLMGGAYWQPLREAIFAVGAEKSPGLYQRVKQGHPDFITLSHQSSAGPDRFTGSPVGPDVASQILDAGRSSSPLSVLPVGMHLLEELPVIGHHPFSDYDAFRNASVPFVFLSAGRTPRYHQPTDLPDTLHYERMAATVQWLDTLIRRIDEDHAPYRFEPHRIELADEVAILRSLVTQASQWKTRIPGTSPLSLYRLKLDAKWLNQLDPTAVKPGDEKTLRRLEHISIRMQCLLANFYGCALF
jgi:hypothetical protein